MQIDCISAGVNRLQRTKDGVTAVEFALVTPALLLILMGGMDVSRSAYVSSVLYGAVQKAGRDSSLETGGATAASIDSKVLAVVQPLANDGILTVSRKSHQTFKRAKRAETYTDSNANNVRDAGECYEDANGNGTWDTAGGKVGLGGSDDIVVYTATFTYPRTFPMAGLMGWNPNEVLTATTILRNQPYGDQSLAIPAVVCT
jgi:Flp pilus assembly protein TadG